MRPSAPSPGSWRGPVLRRYAAYVAVAALTVTLAALYAGSAVRGVARAQTVLSLEQSAGSLAGLIRGGSIADARSLLLRAAIPEVRATLIRADGTVLADSWADAAGLENHGYRPEVKEALNGRVGVASRSSDSVNRELVYVALPPVDVGGQSVVVRTSSAVEGVRAALRPVYGHLALAALVILLSITLLTFVVERKMVEPLVVLERAADAFSRGRLEHTVRVSYPRDLARVAAAMNEMAANLRDRMRDVEEQRNELDAVFASMGEAVLVLDAVQRIRSINAAASLLVGFPRQEAEGRLLLDVLRNTELAELAREVQGSGAPREGEVLLRGVEGSGVGGAVYLQVRGARLERRPGVVLVLNDITRLKRLEEVRRDFVANVSHELKTPITTIKAALETLLDGARDDPEASLRFLRSAARHAERLAAIVDDLLSLSALERPDNGARTMEMEPRDLRDIAHGALQLLAAPAQDKGIALVLDAPEAVKAWVHPRLLEQAIANLVDNAVKYSSSGKTVGVAVRRHDAYAVVSVEDHGIGIPAELLPRVFERFYRVDKARSRDLGGTGLGLAIVKHIALVHGGTVEASSTPGEGSTFSIVLPLLAPTAGAQGPSTGGGAA